ncbi:MAG: signal peptidase II [Pseudomonadota bacterium]
MARVIYISVLVFLVDQASKYWILNGLRLQDIGIYEVFPPFLVFKMAWNQGVNFGLLAGFDARWILVGVSLAIVLGIFIWVSRAPMNSLSKLCAGLLIGGALGNVIDRVLYGAVVDFLNMSCCGVSNPFAFNIADVAIFVGALGLVFFAPSGQSDDDGPVL